MIRLAVVASGGCNKFRMIRYLRVWCVSRWCSASLSGREYDEFLLMGVVNGKWEQKKKEKYNVDTRTTDF